jgi:hypothetical protein
VYIHVMNAEITHSHRQTAIKSLAVVGFVALLGVGVWGAVYSSRFVPGTVGTAAVYLGSLFTPAPPADISVVPTASTTFISFETIAASTTPVVATSTASVATVPSVVTPGHKTETTIPVGEPTFVAGAPYGQPDLTVSASVVGYLSTDSTDSFVANTTIPSGSRPAVKFTIKNIGTNWTGTWRFTAAIPTRTTFTYTSDAQQSLAAGDSIDYTLGFDQALTGSQQPLIITVNDNHVPLESDYTNNKAEFKLNVQ